jgi:hypothetical protein
MLMTAYIFISIILHIASIYFIYILWKKNEELSKKALTAPIEEIEEMLEAFSEIMKEENEQFKKMILNYQHDLMTKTSADLEEDKKNQFPAGESQELTSEMNKDSETQEVLFLAKQGYNATEIAQKLNRGKGEIELLLKFYA